MVVSISGQGEEDHKGKGPGDAGPFPFSAKEPLVRVFAGRMGRRLVGGFALAEGLDERFGSQKENGPPVDGLGGVAELIDNQVEIEQCGVVGLHPDGFDKTRHVVGLGRRCGGEGPKSGVLEGRKPLAGLLARVDQAGAGDYIVLAHESSSGKGLLGFGRTAITGIVRGWGGLVNVNPFEWAVVGGLLC